MSKINLLIAASEVAPFVQTGGLAEVMASLPKYLTKLKVKTSLIIPAYQDIKNLKDFKKFGPTFQVPFGKQNIETSLLLGKLANNIPLYLIYNQHFFNRPGIYGYSHETYPDNDERFIFFSKAVVESLKHLQEKPNIVLANDWQTGLIMPLLNEYEKDIKKIFTIHNLGFIGPVEKEKKNLISLPEKYFSLEGLEFYEKYSLLKAGIVYSDALITVSPTYAQEICTLEGGRGFHGIIKKNQEKLTGILNGIDYKIWNPQTDKKIKANYTSPKLQGKKICKEDILKEYNFAARIDKPLIIMVNRIAEQKGLRLIAEAVDKIAELDFTLIILGTGDKFEEDNLQQALNKHPNKFKLVLDYNSTLAHRLFAAGDFVLAPSLYEPCGLVQLYSLRYGTLPIVRNVGGLNDTVIDPSENENKSTGLKFINYKQEDLILVLEKAKNIYTNKKLLNKMIKNALNQNFSWGNSAKIYQNLFKKLLTQQETSE